MGFATHRLGYASAIEALSHALEVDQPFRCRRRTASLRLACDQAEIEAHNAVAKPFAWRERGRPLPRDGDRWSGRWM